MWQYLTFGLFEIWLGVVRSCEWWRRGWKYWGRKWRDCNERLFKQGWFIKDRKIRFSRWGKENEARVLCAVFCVSCLPQENCLLPRQPRAMRIVIQELSNLAWLERRSEELSVPLIISRMLRAGQRKRKIGARWNVYATHIKYVSNLRWLVDEWGQVFRKGILEEIWFLESKRNSSCASFPLEERMKKWKDWRNIRNKRINELFLLQLPAIVAGSRCWMIEWHFEIPTSRR